MTTYDAQIHCSGVQSVLDNPRSFSRKLKFANGGNFFPLLPDSGLGFDFGCYNHYSFFVLRAGIARVAWAPDEHWHVLQLKNYVEQKQRALAGLRESLEQGMRCQPT